MTYNITQNSRSQIQPQSPEISAMELALLGGDLSKLSEGDRAAYYSKVCESVGLNPLTWPFEYIRLNGKLKLYAKKDCTDQLRSLRGVSISKAETRIESGLAIVEVTATTKDGRSDCDMGCVPITGLSGESLGNALMKAVTKAKRRVTLSICGLGWLDETELDFVKSEHQPIQQPEKIKAIAPTPKLLAAQSPQDIKLRGIADSLIRELKLSQAQVQIALNSNFTKEHPDHLTDSELIKFSEYLCEYRSSGQELKRAGWTPAQGTEFLKQNFDKTTRVELTFPELAEFVEFLKQPN